MWGTSVLLAFDKALAKHYQNNGCPVHGSGAISLDDDYRAPNEGIEEGRMAEIYSRVKSGKTAIDSEIYEHTRKTLEQGVRTVYGTPRYDSQDFETAHKITQSTARFSGFKSAWQTALLRKAENLQTAQDINQRYNVNYLRTEYVHTVRGSSAAKNWARFEKDKDLYPNLEYVPSVAAEPRNEHKRLYGIVKPVDDVFWDTWLPPNDWGCKCSVRQVRGTGTGKKMPEDIKYPPNTMRNNPGKTGQVFTDRHPMVSKLDQNIRGKIGQETEKLVRKTLRDETKKTLSNEFLNQTFSIEVEGVGVETQPLTMSRIKEFVNQPHNDDVLKNRAIAQLYLIVKESEYSHSSPSEKGKTQFRRFHYLKARNIDLLINVAENHKGEFIVWSVTESKKPKR